MIATLYRPHRFIGGPPPRRIYKMQLAHERRARTSGVPWEMVDFRRVYAAAGGVCGICQQPVALDVFTIDHVVPLSKGGVHKFENLQLAHRACNSRKGNRPHAAAP